MSDQHRISDQSWRETLMERDQLIAALRQQLVELDHAHDEILALRQQLAAERSKRCESCGEYDPGYCNLRGHQADFDMTCSKWRKRESYD